MPEMEERTAIPGLRVVGLLGGIGSGKSTVADLLGKALEAPVLSADAEVAALLERPEMARRIEAALGEGLLSPDGGLDRRAVAARVFQDPEARAVLEKILHPEVRMAIHAALARLEASGKPAWAVLDVPLLLEGGLDAICDLLVHVAAPSEVRAERACQRHGWSREEWEAREAAQIPTAEKEARSDAILDNGRSPEDTRDQVQDLLPRIRALPPRSLMERWPAWDQDPPRRRP